MSKFYYEIENSNIAGTVKAYTKKGAIAKIYRRYGDVSGRICHMESLPEILIGAVCVVALPVMLLVIGTIFKGVM